MSMKSKRVNRRNLHTRKQLENQRQDENGADCDCTEPASSQDDDNREEWERYLASHNSDSQPR